MAPKILAPAIVATLALIACTTGIDGSSLPCNSGVCKLEVSVAAAGCANPANITVTPDPLPVPKGSPNKIEWTIKTDGYTWVAEPGGVTGLPAGMFKNPHATGSGKKYDIHDDNTDSSPTDYKYAIHLTAPNGSLCAVKDPFIRNGS